MCPQSSVGSSCGLRSAEGRRCRHVRKVHVYLYERTVTSARSWKRISRESVAVPACQPPDDGYYAIVGSASRHRGRGEGA